ncbi:MAG: HIT domain-containing protein [Spirochaetes bacterium]|nr:MAG: HIT domain-containing protein [Spirochaetota bacterium]
MGQLDRVNSDYNFMPCKVCGFELYLPIAALQVSQVALYDDARYPGRLIVSLNQHFDHIEEVDPDVFVQFWSDIRACSRALRSLSNVTRVNVALLGNSVPHVHAHVFPRRQRQEQNSNKSPWSSAPPLTHLTEDSRKHYVALIGKYLIPRTVDVGSHLCGTHDGEDEC